MSMKSDAHSRQQVTLPPASSVMSDGKVPACLVCPCALVTLACAKTRRAGGMSGRSGSSRRPHLAHLSQVQMRIEHGAGEEENSRIKSIWTHNRSHLSQVAAPLVRCPSCAASTKAASRTCQVHRPAPATACLAWPLHCQPSPASLLRFRLCRSVGYDVIYFVHASKRVPMWGEGERQKVVQKMFRGGE